MTIGVVGRDLIERDDELGILRGILHDARAGQGGVAVVEAPAGQGKTALLRTLRAEATTEGFRVLSATGAALEKEFPFGLVRQLFEAQLHGMDDARRAALFTGAAALARPVLEADLEESGATDVSHARLHGLYWLTVNLAEEGPLLLVVDDAHWGDRPSLRYLDGLARRIEDLPAMLAIGARPAEPDAEQDILDSLVAGPSVTVLRPPALSFDGVRALVEDALAANVDPKFADAAFETTAGNPLLVRELARTLVAEGFTGSADEVEDARRAVPGTITRTVVGRLRRLAPEALAVARALAVLGDRAQIADVAALGGVEPAAARTAHATLVRVGLVDPEHLRFVHPLVQEAVAADLVGSERSTWHRRAARLLAEAGAGVDELALHLVHGDPEGDAWTATVLADAGRKALADGAPETAARLLERALAEPPAPADVPALHLSLGMAKAAMGTSAALAHLDAAVAAGDPATAARAAAFRANRLIIVGRADEAADSLRGPLAAVAPVDEELTRLLQDVLLDALPYRDDYRDEYTELVEAGAAEGRAAALAHLCAIRAANGARRDEVVELARRALADGTLVQGVTVERFTPFYVIDALNGVEAEDEAAAALNDCRDVARRAGSVAGMTSLAFIQPQWDRRFGDLRRAEGDLREALALTQPLDARAAVIMLRGLLAGVLADRGAIEEADRLVALLPATEGAKERSTGVHAARARVRLEQGRHEEALAELERHFEIERRQRRKVTNREEVRALATRALAGLGRVDEARAVADKELEFAQSRQVAGAEAAIRLARAALFELDEALDEIKLAVEVAERSPSRLVRARALAALGAALRRAGRRADAREPLRQARELAHQCGATALEHRIHDDLVIAGARPRRVALSGLDSLTPAERRVAELAAQGMRNRDIAETLFVTLKTVEVHLGRTYAKLDIKGRSQLAEVLGTQH